MNLLFLHQEQLDNIIYLGAGNFLGTDFVFNENSTVHLVDADDKVTSRLGHLYEGQKKVIIYSAVISDKTGTSVFRRYSLCEFNGIAKPTGLKALYPGLKQLDSETKQATSIDEFITNLNLDSKKINSLVIDIPGVSATLLQSLVKSQIIHIFGILAISVAQQPLFEDELPVSDLIKMLENNGFSCHLSQSDESDFIVIQARLNPLFVELSTTKIDLTESRKTLDIIKEKHREMQKDSQSILGNFKSEQKNIEKIAQTVATLESEKLKINMLCAAQRSQIEIINQKNNELLKQLDQQQKALANSSDALSVSVSVAENSKKNIEIILEERNDARSERETLKQEIKKQNNDFKQKTNQLEQKRLENNIIRKQHQTLTLANQAYQQIQIDLEAELIKAESQINIIKELLVNRHD